MTTFNCEDCGCQINHEGTPFEVCPVCWYEKAIAAPALRAMPPPAEMEVPANVRPPYMARACGMRVPFRDFIRRRASYRSSRNFGPDTAAHLLDNVYQLLSDLEAGRGG